MVQLDHFQIEAGPQDLDGLAGEPEERVDPDRVVRGPDDRDVRSTGANLRLLCFAVAGGADDEGFLVLDAQGGHRGSDTGKAEFDDDVTPGDDGAKVVALVNLADDLDFREARGAGQERLAHAAPGAVNNDVGHALF